GRPRWPRPPAGRGRSAARSPAPLRSGPRTALSLPPEQDPARRGASAPRSRREYMSELESLGLKRRLTASSPPLSTVGAGSKPPHGGDSMKPIWPRALESLALLTVIAACGGTPASSVDVGKASLTGAGATFPEPFYTKAFYVYNQTFPQVSVNYQAVGSGAGIQQFTKGTVDFGASDVPMQDADV